VFQVLGTPINPARVEIQSDWQEEVLYPSSVCTLEVNVSVQTVPPVARAEPPSKEGKAKAVEPEKPPLPIIDTFLDDSDGEQAYSSSEEEGEVYIRGKLGKKRKVAVREDLPRGREPVSNPLTLEERIRRKETRVANRLVVRRNNLSMIRLLMRGVADKLHFAPTYPTFPL
jgi:hypothetical protein